MKPAEETLRGPDSRVLAGVKLKIFPTKAAAGQAAGREAEQLIRRAIGDRGVARIVVGAANSQLEIMHTIATSGLIDWAHVEVFHMDEYVGLPDTHPASFRRWVKEHLVDPASAGRVHYVKGDAVNPEEEAVRYARLLSAAPIDLVLLGFGENGHIAFNDPHVADFNDPDPVKVVEMDERCRQQQVGEGHFENLAAVPRKAITLTCSALFSAREWIATVPEKRKAEAVKCAFLGPISEDCPASLIRRHPSVSVYLDTDSASLLLRDCP